MFACWGIAHGLSSPDLTVLRFGVAGVLMLPVFALAWRRDEVQLIERWKVWLMVALFAGTPFGLLMFGALQFAPPSHAAVFPFTAMSVMGMVLGALVLGDRMTHRRVLGIAVVLVGLVLVSGVDAASLTLRASLGDAVFLVAGTLWAGFGIVSRKHRLDPRNRSTSRPNGNWEDYHVMPIEHPAASPTTPNSNLPISASRHVSTDINQNIEGLKWQCSDCIATAAPAQSVERER